MISDCWTPKCVPWIKVAYDKFWVREWDWFDEVTCICGVWLCYILNSFYCCFHFIFTLSGTVGTFLTVLIFIISFCCMYLGQFLSEEGCFSEQLAHWVLVHYHATWIIFGKLYRLKYKTMYPEYTCVVALVLFLLLGICLQRIDYEPIIINYHPLVGQ